MSLASAVRVMAATLRIDLNGPGLGATRMADTGAVVARRKLGRVGADLFAPTGIGATARARPVTLLSGHRAAMQHERRKRQQHDADDQKWQGA